jgi:DNA-binding NarL/FixJ family response regulator
MSIRVIVADDHPITRAGTVAILQREEDIEVVGEAEDGTAALALCQESRPDLAILDVRMPGLSGIEVAQKLHAQPEHPRILLLTGYADPAMVRAASMAGVTSYALKSLPGQELVARVRQLVHDRAQPAEGADEAKRIHDPLSPDEMITLCLAAKGLGVRDIAKHRAESITLVADRLASLSRKLGARTYPDAVLIAQREGLIAER